MAPRSFGARFRFGLRGEPGSHPGPVTISPPFTRGFRFVVQKTGGGVKQLQVGFRAMRSGGRIASLWSPWVVWFFGWFRVWVSIELKAEQRLHKKTHFCTFFTSYLRPIERSVLRGKRAKRDILVCWVSLRRSNDRRSGTRSERRHFGETVRSLRLAAHFSYSWQEDGLVEYTNLLERRGEGVKQETARVQAQDTV